MKKFLSVVLAGLMVFGAAACSSNDNKNNSSFSVAMVTDVGGVKDESFNQSAWEGLESAKADYGIKVSYLESVQESNYGPNLDKLTDEGHNIIWGIGFMMADAVLNAATINAEQNYAIVDSAYTDTPANLTGVVFKAQEPSFLVGYLAARTTKTNKIGFVGGIKGEVIDQFEFGYRAGVAYANKEKGTNVEVVVQYANSFADDAAGKAIATTMYTEGCDIVFHAAGYVGKGVFEAAKEMNKLVIGVDRDQSDLAPDNTLTSSLKLVGKAMKDVSKKLLDGEKIGGKTLVFGLKEEACDFANNESTKKLATEEAISATTALKAKIIDGTIVVPANEADFDLYVAGL